MTSVPNVVRRWFELRNKVVIKTQGELEMWSSSVEVKAVGRVAGSRKSGYRL